MNQEQPVNSESGMSRQERRRLEREAMRRGDNGNPGPSTWWIWVGVLVLLALIVGGIIALVVSNSSTPTNAQLSTPIGAGDWVVGSTASSSVSLVEYSDFQCPACAYYAPWVGRLVKDVPNIQVAYRFFPLRQIHKNADLAAKAAQTAGLQGKFWEMHDLLFTKQTEWADSANAAAIFSSYAKSLGLNVGQFEKDLTSAAVKEKVDADFQSGVASGVNATPSFFLNGKFINNPGSYEEFLQIIASSTPRS